MNRRCSRILFLILCLAAVPVGRWALAAGVPAQGAAPAAAQVKKPKPGPACKDNGQCSRNQYCQKRAGKCGGQGQCVVRPQVCPLFFDPVCGCDGVTYGNFCFAAMAGANVKHAGACERTCTKNAECAKNQYCAKATGDCKGRGQCTPKPEVCPEIFDPVCGCDGKVYGNACEAAAAGVNVSKLGEECKKP